MIKNSFSYVMWAVLDLVLFICLSWSVHVCGVAFFLLKYPQTYVHVFFTSFLCCPTNGTCLTLTLNLSQILTGILLFTHFCLMTQYYVRVTSLPCFTIFLVNSSRTPSFTHWSREQPHKQTNIHTDVTLKHHNYYPFFLGWHHSPHQCFISSFYFLD